jgi:hypothetical protein
MLTPYTRLIQILKKDLMPKINQKQVMDQRTGSHGKETCGYHTFKNSLLSLMHIQGLINDTQLVSMLNDKALFKTLLDATKTHHKNGDMDLTLPGFMTLLKQAKEGGFNFAKHGVTKDILKKLHITPDGTQGITVANYSLYPNAPGHGLGGMEEDLLVAAATVKLAKTQGQANHVFALGLNNQHWVTAAVNQNVHGVRSWQFMDSYGNHSIYRDTVVNKIETVLNKSEPELQRYLQEVYSNSSDLFFRRYKSFFDDRTGLPLLTKVDIQGNGLMLVNAKEYFIDKKETMEQFTLWIENRFQFMDSAGWLTSTDELEQLWVKQLYNLTHFIVENTSVTNPKHVVVKSKLQPIYDRLKAAQHQVPVIQKPEVKPVVTLEQETEELAKIRTNAFDIKGHFKLLFDSTLANTEIPDKVQIVDSLVNENTLSAQLKKDYLGKDYVVMFYAHKPHSSEVSPEFPNEDRAHTSVLLCKVNNNKIEQILNVDGYNYTDYVDILGERPGATRNPDIQQRLVIQPMGPSSHNKTPLQRASWYNMNCVLYSLTFVEQIIDLFKGHPELMRSVFPANKTEKITPESLLLLEKGILEGLVGKYVKKTGGDYVYDDDLKDQHHKNLRELLAEQYALKCATERQAQDTIPEPIQDIVDEPDHEENDPFLSLQQQTSLDAVNNGTPKATEGFTDRLVKAIKWILEGIKDLFVSIGQKMGLIN